MVNATRMAEVRAIIEDRPDRLEQAHWIGLADGFTWPLEADRRIPVEDLRVFAWEDMPDEPMDWQRPICGTTACVAGWVAILAAPAGTYVEMTGVGTFLTLPDDLYVVAVEAYARDELGLSDRQAHWLFESDRSRSAVLWALEYLPGNPDADLAEAYYNSL